MSGVPWRVDHLHCGSATRSADYATFALLEEMEMPLGSPLSSVREVEMQVDNCEERARRWKAGR